MAAPEPAAAARRALRILGTRGVPAAHGGFETFAEQLALHLVARGWAVTVYCQTQGQGPVRHDQWQGVQRVHIPVAQADPLGTIVFDWRATRHAMHQRELCLTLGYNTAVFCALLRLAGVPNLINMDGVEWRRAKWGRVAKLWFWLNEHAGSRLANHLVADHPEIKRHLARVVAESKITTIAYGADAVSAGRESEERVHALGLQPGRYISLVARPEPENSVLEVVQGFSKRPRGLQLVVLGAYCDSHPYHRAVRAAASNEVRFVGAIYDKPVVQALRAHSAAYVHGHQVGGTNPSLVEALGAGNAVLAHDNPFNRWVAQDAARYFNDAPGFAQLMDAVQADPALLVTLRAAARRRFEAEFTWPHILQQYEELLLGWLRANPSFTTGPANDR